MTPPQNNARTQRFRPATLVRDGIAVFLGVMLAAVTAQGIQYADTATLVTAALVLTLCNVVLKPILILFALPFVLMTLGLGIWLINAVLFYFVGAIIPGFEVATFTAALWGALILSLINFALFILFTPKTARGHFRVNINGRSWGSSGKPDSRSPRERIQRKNDDVIDV